MTWFTVNGSKIEEPNRRTHTDLRNNRLPYVAHRKLNA